MGTPTILGAFFAGVLTFLSPCILPLLPGYISFMSGESLENLKDGSKKTPRIKAFLGALCFGAGFSLVFIALGAAATSIGQLLSDYKLILARVAGVVIIIFGLHMAGAFRINFLLKQARFNYKRGGAPFFIQAFILGIAFVLGWTPCVGPILSGILALAAVETSLQSGILLLVIYAIGLWIPFLIAALLVNEAMAFVHKASKYVVWTERIAGALLVLIGVLLVTDNMTRITVFFLKLFPFIPTI